MHDKREARRSLENSRRAYPDRVNEILSKPYGALKIGLFGAFLFFAAPWFYIALFKVMGV